MHQACKVKILKMLKGEMCRERCVKALTVQHRLVVFKARHALAITCALVHVLDFELPSEGRISVCPRLESQSYMDLPLKCKNALYVACGTDLGEGRERMT